MRERPILFNGPMVSAILAGSKTCTRRLVKGVALDWLAPGMFTPGYVASPANGCSPFGTGDRLWVREAWADVHPIAVQEGRYSQPGMAGIPGPPPVDYRTVYRADGEVLPHWRRRDHQYPYFTTQKADSDPMWSDTTDGGLVPWHPSIHMPRWACRLVLEVIDVRIERLHDGDGEVPYESRYLAEGINRIHHGDGDFYYSAFRDEPAPGNWADPFDAWRELWQSTGADWDSNPWVWVVEFRRATP